MLIRDMNWMQVQAYLQHDDRVLLPVGSTEQHAYLSLMTDAVLAGNVAAEAAEPLGIPVMPVLPFGMAPYFTGFPGTVSLSPALYFSLIRELLDNLYRTGFRRILIVNGHGGNSPVLAEIQDWLSVHEDARVKLHNWWAAPAVMKMVGEIDAVASHASWMENFPSTRLDGVEMPAGAKEMVDLSLLRQLGAQGVRDLVGDGNYGGAYSKPDVQMDAVWQAGVADTRRQIENNWA